MRITPRRVNARQRATQARATCPPTRIEKRNSRSRHAARMLLLGAVTVISIGGYASEQDDPLPNVPDHSLRMSTSLTWDTAPNAPAPPTIDGAPAMATPVASAEPSRPNLLAWLTAALGLIAGTWLSWRRPRDLTPAQDRLAVELTRTRERYVRLLEQRSRKRHPDWDSTVKTLKHDLVSARAIMDRLRDEKRAVETELYVSAEQMKVAELSNESLMQSLASAQDDLAQARKKRAEEQAQGARLQATLKATQAESRSRRDMIVDLTKRVEDADAQRERADGLGAAVAAANNALSLAEQRVASLESTLAETTASLAEMLDKNVALEATLSDARAAHTAGDAQAPVHVTGSAGPLPGDDQAKRRILAILQCEKAAAAATQAELDKLRLEHATALEHQETMQKMLVDEQSRIDEQAGQIATLEEQNGVLRRHVTSKVHSPVEKDASIERLEPKEVNTLAQAQLAIRRLKEDLRLRCDMVDALRAEAKVQGDARQALLERDKYIAVLQNETSMAQQEAARLRELHKKTPRVSPRDLITLRKRIDGLEARIMAKEKEIAELHSPADGEMDVSQMRDHVTRLKRGRDASIAIVRFLEDEVQKLSADLRGTTSGML